MGRPFVITQESAVTGQPLSRGGLSVTVRTFLPKVLKPPVESWLSVARGAAGAVCRGVARAGVGAGRVARGCSHEIVLTNCQDVTDGQVARRRAPSHAAVSRQVPFRRHPKTPRRHQLAHGKVFQPQGVGMVFSLPTVYVPLLRRRGRSLVTGGVNVACDDEHNVPQHSLRASQAGVL